LSSLVDASLKRCSEERVAHLSDTKDRVANVAKTVVGKAFFDIGHSLKDKSKNRRRNLPGYAAWEIHPMMVVHVDA
jgi:hypothetical protein